MKKFGLIAGTVLCFALALTSMISWVKGIPIAFENVILTNIVKIALGLSFLPGILGTAFCAATLTKDPGPGNDFGNN